MIMPLANSRDKRTQVVWGIKDFEFRFNRKPEGMWLAETAVDIPTLELLAEHGIEFTILAPGQAAKFRKLGDQDWLDASGAKIDPKRAYICNLPSGRKINLFFYDGPISHNIAFGNLLSNGENLAKRLLGAFFYGGEKDQIVHIATDGETFGHHHKYGEMALSYCLYYLEDNNFAEVTNYSNFLKMHPPKHEVAIIENTSWSCAHGVERWRSDCSCATGGRLEWNQKWRAPLRQAMDWLSGQLASVFEEHGGRYFKDAWAAREEYIRVLLDRRNLNQFLEQHLSAPLDTADKVKAIKLLEMQRYAMLMFTSCGWFFDELSGIETVQIMMYSARAMQLAKEAAGHDLEPHYLALLEAAQSNIPEFGNGKNIYEKLVKPQILDLYRVGAHYTVSSLFEDYPKKSKIYCYTADNTAKEQYLSGKQKLSLGSAVLRSDITLEEQKFCYAVLHFGDHNLIGGIAQALDEAACKKMREEMKMAFLENDIQHLMALMDHSFGSHSYSFWHLFKDEQRHILKQVIDSTYGEIETSFQNIYEKHYPVMRAMRQFNIPLPKALSFTVEVVFNSGLRKLLEADNIDLVRLQRMVDSMIFWGIEVDRQAFGYFGTESLNRMMEKLAFQKENSLLLESLETFLVILNQLGVALNLWKAQNLYFEISKSVYPDIKRRADRNEPAAKKWVKQFGSLGDQLKVKI